MKPIQLMLLILAMVCIVAFGSAIASALVGEARYAMNALMVSLAAAMFCLGGSKIRRSPRGW